MCHRARASGEKKGDAVNWVSGSLYNVMNHRNRLNLSSHDEDSPPNWTTAGPSRQCNAQEMKFAKTPPLSSPTSLRSVKVVGRTI